MGQDIVANGRARPDLVENVIAGDDSAVGSGEDLQDRHRLRGDADGFPRQMDAETLGPDDPIAYPELTIHKPRPAVLAAGATSKMLAPPSPGRDFGLCLVEIAE